MYDNRYFFGTVENTPDIIRELKKKYGVSFYHFIDDAFHPKFMKKLAEGLIKQKPDIEWSTFSILVEGISK